MLTDEEKHQKLLPSVTQTYGINTSRSIQCASVYLLGQTAYMKRADCFVKTFY